MESNNRINCAIRVKEEPSDAPLIGNDCGMIDEKPDLKNIQLLPFFRENLIHISRKCEGNNENELADEAKIVFECEDMKPNNNLRTKDDYQTQSLINIEPVGEVKQEYFNDAAEESNLNFNDQLVEKNKKRRVQENLNQNGLKTNTGSDHNATTHQCEVCGKKFSTKGNLKMHISTLHKGVKHACNICGKTFSQKVNLKIHIDTKHNGVTYSCDICGKKYSTKSCLKLHMDSRHNGVIYKCDLCERKCYTKTHLKTHIKTVHNGFRHSCDICEKKFTEKSKLKIHIDAVHYGVTHKCDICGKKYSTKSYLKNHIDSNHNGA